MTDNTIIPISVLLLGAIITLVSILKFSPIYDEVKYTYRKSVKKLKRYFMAKLLCLIAFLVSYILLIVTIVFKWNLNLLILESVLLLASLSLLFSVLLNRKIMESKKEHYFQLLRVLVSAMEMRDHYTKGHSEHVANLLKLLHHHIPKEKRIRYMDEIIEAIGLLHDVGKLGVPEVILNKSGRLDEKEWDFMKKHPTFGSNLLSIVDDYEEISRWIECHHERVDGKGYMELSADEIPYFSKLIAVADTYSALVTNRSYRPRKTHEEACEILRSVKGQQLDDSIVEIFCGIDKDEVEKTEPEKLGFETIDEIEKDIETYFEERKARKIINIESATSFLEKMLNLAEQEKSIFTIGKVNVSGTKEGVQVEDYHDADEISENIGKALIESTRESDLIFRLTRNSFLMLFPNNPRTNVEKLLERLEDKINSIEVVRKKQLTITMEKEFAHFDPKDARSFNEVRDFIGMSA